MSKLVALLNANNIFYYQDAKNFLSQKPYCLDVKSDDYLYRFFYTSESDMTNEVVQECAGIILEMSTNKVVCYGMNAFKESIETVVSCTEAIDGVQIKMFYYNDMWKYATRKSIDANKAFWGTEKSFQQLFLGAMDEVGFSTDIIEKLLNKNMTYTFVFQHPEFRNVSVVHEHQVYHISSRDMEILIEVPITSGKGHLNVDLLLPQMDPYYTSVSDWQFQGLVFQDANFNRLKTVNLKWEHVKHIKGNYPDLEVRVLELIKNEDKHTLDIFEEYFNPVLVYNVRTKYNQLITTILDKFKYYFIQQNMLDSSERFYYVLMAMYVIYKKTKIRTNLQTCREVVQTLPLEVLSGFLGYN